MTDIDTPIGLPDPAPDAVSTRRERILESAARAFSTHGYHGSSLRNIARSADTSLTLLDHHFGGKSELLDAVIEHQHRGCEERLGRLRDAVHQAPRLALSEFVERWGNYQFDLCTTAQGRVYLQLTARLAMEAEVDPDKRRDLDCARKLVVKAFRQMRPSLDEGTLQMSWRLASAALYAAIQLAYEEDGTQGVESDARRRGAIAFIVDGLAGFWSRCDLVKPATDAALR